MRKPQTIEQLYLDFDGFFAGVEEQARPALRGRPIGVVPFAGVESTCVIAANYKAKKFHIKTGTPVWEARKLCPDIALVPQSPDLYVRAHHKLLSLIAQEIPIEQVCSIDELTCKLDPFDIADPYALAQRIKKRIFTEVGPYITCSIGVAPNRLLAKIAGDMDKPNGFTVLHPEKLPGRLFDLPIEDIPGVGRRMKKRLIDVGIWTVEALWHTEPKQMRKIWNNVEGERLWYALHGYEMHVETTERSMIGHGRVLPPESRHFDGAYEIARLLTVKAARRLRRESYVSDAFSLHLRYREGRWARMVQLGHINDDHAALGALKQLWGQAHLEMPANVSLLNFHVSFSALAPATQYQLNMFGEESGIRKKWLSICETMDQVNNKYARTALSLGPWKPPHGGHAGGKIAFTRVPSKEDFW